MIIAPLIMNVSIDEAFIRNHTDAFSTEVAIINKIDTFSITRELRQLHYFVSVSTFAQTFPIDTRDLFQACFDIPTCKSSHIRHQLYCLCLQVSTTLHLAMESEMKWALLIED